MKQDPKLLAAKEDNGRELHKLAYTYQIKTKELREILKEMNPGGENPRSMEEVKAELEKRGKKRREKKSK